MSLFHSNCPLRTVRSSGGIGPARFLKSGCVVHPIAMRNVNRCILSALAAGVLAAQSLSAQDTTQVRTHTVVRGDNLWDLAQKYLGVPANPNRQAGQVRVLYVIEIRRAVGQG